MLNITHTLEMNNGVAIPQLGFGVFLSPDGKETVEAVNWALEAGYRHIDTATIYRNEASVGKAVKESGLDRSEIFLTTKLWNSDAIANKQQEAFERSLDLLETDFLDLYLIHRPIRNRIETWKALENILASGKVRAIGVSNFHEGHLEELRQETTIIPAINQVEFHPYQMQMPIVMYCMEHGILFEAWSPLGGAKSTLFNEKLLKNLAVKYEKTIAQILLRWDLQHGIVTIPKSNHRARIIENADIFDFEISEDDMIQIDGLDRDHSFGPGPYDVPSTL